MAYREVEVMHLCRIRAMLISIMPLRYLNDILTADGKRQARWPSSDIPPIAKLISRFDIYADIGVNKHRCRCLLRAPLMLLRNVIS